MKKLLTLIATLASAVALQAMDQQPPKNPFTVTHTYKKAAVAKTTNPAQTTNTTPQAVPTQTMDTKAAHDFFEFLRNYTLNAPIKLEEYGREQLTLRQEIGRIKIELIQQPTLDKTELKSLQKKHEQIKSEEMDFIAEMADFQARIQKHLEQRLKNPAQTKTNQ